MRSSLEELSGKRPKWLERILTNTGKFSILVYILGVYYMWMIMGGHGPFAEHTRISEHALMPGLVTERFDMDGKLSEYLKELKNMRKGNLRDFICKELEVMGVSCYLQHWSTAVTIQNKTGVNAYGVVRASRATGVEAMLVAADLSNREAVAAVLAYAAFAREQVYWARDIFFVFTEGAAYGMDAFLSSYHLAESTGIRGDPLDAAGGLLIGGVVLKSQPVPPKRRATHAIQLEINQLNGQLPNLDLFNSVVRIAGKAKFALQSQIYGIDESDEIRQEFPVIIPLRALYVQAFTAIEGAHSVMGKYGVQGLSVSLAPAAIYPLGKSTRLVEAIIRSMNNVLERFHQSYFLYILTNEDSFLSIAYYMPAMAVVLPLLMFAYREWVKMVSFRWPVGWVIPHCIGIITLVLSKAYMSSTPESYNYIMYLVLILAVPWGLLTPVPSCSQGALRFFLYLEVALVTTAIALVNFGLGFFSAVVAVPLILRLTSQTESSNKILLRVALALLCHPFCIYLGFLVYIEPLLLYPAQHASIDFQTLITGFGSIVRDYLVFGSWMYPLLVFFAIPVWNCSLMLAATKEENEPTENIKSE